MTATAIAVGDGVDAVTISSPPGLRTASRAFSALLQFVIAAYVFAFFAGLDRAVFDSLLGPGLGADWLRQVYNFCGMVAFGLLGLRMDRRVIGAAAINLVLVPFNAVNPFVTRIGLGFWVGYAGGVLSFRSLLRAARAGVIVGSAAVILDGLYVTFIHATKTFGAGFFGIPNFVAGVALGMPFLVGTRVPKIWATMVVVACIFSGSNSAMLVCLVAVWLTFGFTGARVLVAGVLIAVTFALTFTTPLNYTYKTRDRFVVSLDLAKTAGQAVLGVSRRPPVSSAKGGHRPSPVVGFSQTVSDDVHKVAMQDRTRGVKPFTSQGWRLLLPLSHVRANDLGHIGIELYIATYGIAMCLLYFFLAYKVLPTPMTVFLCVLLPLFTDPLYEFGVGLLALRAVWPPPTDPHYGKPDLVA